jgi:RNA polymerase sigma factor (sigma-70 family)
MQRPRHLRPVDAPPPEPSEEQVAPLAEPAFDRMSPLVDAAQRGDRRALEELLGLLAQPLLRAVCALIGRDHPDVDDLVQDVLIDVASALPSFRGECTLLHFAIRIAARKATARRRRASSVRGFLARFETQEDKVREPVPSPGEVALAESRRRVLCELLADLPEEQAETMVLRALLGHSIEEIAAITRAPINTVRSRLRLAKDALRKRLASDPSALELLEGA